MVNIQSAIAEIRLRGKQEEDEEEETGPKYNVRINASTTQGGHNK